MSDNLHIKAQQLHKHLNQWVERKPVVVQILKQLADDLDEHFQKISIAKVAGSATSIVGGILGIVGFGLSFVTFGASLGLTIAGSVISGLGGITVGGSMITDAFISDEKRRLAQTYLNEYNKQLEMITTECIEIGNLLKLQNMKMDNWKHFWVNLVFGGGSAIKGFSWNVLGSTLRTSLKISASFTDDVIAVSAKASTTAFKTIGSTTGRSLHIVGGVGGIVFMALDIKTLVKSATNIHTKNPHKGSRKIRALAEHINENVPTKEKIETMINDTFYRHI